MTWIKLPILGRLFAHLDNQIRRQIVDSAKRKVGTVMQKMLMPLLLFMAMVGATFFTLPAAGASAQSRTICANDPVPTGSVVTSFRVSIACPDSIFPRNAKVVTPVREGLVVCDAGPAVSAPFVMTQVRYVDRCNANPFVNPGLTNSFVARAAEHGTVACGGSQVPPGFTRTSQAERSSCDRNPAAPSTGLANSFILRGRPNIGVVAATGSPDGVLHQQNNVGAFALATSNGGAGARMTVTARTSGIVASVVLCETNPANGQCLSPASGSVTTRIEGGETPTFSVFVGTAGTIPLDPANRNVTVDFRDRFGVLRGSTTVAVTTN